MKFLVTLRSTVGFFLGKMMVIVREELEERENTPAIRLYLSLTTYKMRFAYNDRVPELPSLRIKKSQTWLGALHLRAIARTSRASSSLKGFITSMNIHHLQKGWH